MIKIESRENETIMNFLDLKLQINQVLIFVVSIVKIYLTLYRRKRPCLSFKMLNNIHERNF